MARQEIVPAELGVDMRYAPSGMTKAKRPQPKRVHVRLTPEELAAAVPAPGQPAHAFNMALLPFTGREPGTGGSSKPDFFVLTAGEIIPVEITLRSTWSKENVETRKEGGARLHKESQAAKIMFNLQPFLEKNPHMKVQLIFISDREPDKAAISAIERLANKDYPEQISAIKWLHF